MPGQVGLSRWLIQIKLVDPVVPTGADLLDVHLVLSRRSSGEHCDRELVVDLVDAQDVHGGHHCPPGVVSRETSAPVHPARIMRPYRSMADCCNCSTVGCSAPPAAALAAALAAAPAAAHTAALAAA